MSLYACGRNVNSGMSPQGSLVCEFHLSQDILGHPWLSLAWSMFTNPRSKMSIVVLGCPLKLYSCVQS